MKIGLIDVDGHNFPNVPLMKLSAHHKKLGYEVEKIDYPILAKTYDRVYMSKVFTFTTDYMYPVKAEEVIKGGIGYGLDKDIKLCNEIEHIYPDYDLYDIKGAYGFLSRGCPRDCAFCNVSQHQGYISTKVADLQEFWKDQKEIILLDPNILACKEWQYLLNQLIDSKAYIDFSQGLDIRLMTDKKAYMLNQIKTKMIHFAWDNYEFKTYGKLKEFRKQLKFDKRKLTVYVLVNYNTTLEQDLERVYKLKELNYSPYIMIYNKEKAARQIRRLQRWVNNRFVFRSCDRFEDYKA